MRPHRVGVIGCGGIAQMMHLPFIVDHPHLFDLVGLCDVNSTTLEVVARRFHVPNAVTRQDELLALPIDAVLVLTSGTHAPAICAAAGAGKHVFTEKPLAFSPAEVRTVQAAIREAGVTCMVGYMKRYDPAYRQARALVAGLRDLIYVQVTVWHPDDSLYRIHHTVFPPPVVGEWVPGSGRPGWAVDQVTSGPVARLIDDAIGAGGPIDQRIAYFLMCDSLVHQVSAIRGILGDPLEVLSTTVWHDAQGIASTFRFPGDVLCTLTWVSLPALKRYQEQYLFLSPEARVELEYPSPYLRHFPTRLTVRGMDGESAWEKHVTVSHREAFHEELLHFHHCVTTGEPPETGVDEALRDAETIVAMAKAYTGPGPAGPR
jgi:predicted dehydrogenase